MLAKFSSKTAPYRLIFNVSIGVLIIFTIYCFGWLNAGSSRIIKFSDVPSAHIETAPSRSKPSNVPETKKVPDTSISISTTALIKTSSFPSISPTPTTSILPSENKNSSAVIEAENNENAKDDLPPAKISKMLVVAGMKDEDYSWIHDHLEGWESIVYYSDDVTAPHHMVVNKGREPAVYLTYILENYHNLRNVTVFVHATREAWHNDFGLQHYSRDLLYGLRSLRAEYVLSQRYMNLRCSRYPGCDPPSVPLNDTTDQKDSLNAFRKAFPHLHPGSKLPDEIGAPCCAQFAVSRDQILARPRSDYERYYKWVMGADTSEWNAGWIFEYTWHIIFGKVSVDCRSTEEDCTCNLYGFCKEGRTSE